MSSTPENNIPPADNDVVVVFDKGEESLAGSPMNVGTELSDAQLGYEIYITPPERQEWEKFEDYKQRRKFQKQLTKDIKSGKVSLGEDHGESTHRNAWKRKSKESK